jgi:hypothetical protein
MATRGMVAGRCNSVGDRGSSSFEIKTVFKDRIVEKEVPCKLPKVKIIYFKEETSDINIVVLNLDDKNLLI